MQLIPTCISGYFLPHKPLVDRFRRNEIGILEVAAQRFSHLGQALLRTAVLVCGVFHALYFELLLWPLFSLMGFSFGEMTKEFIVRSCETLAHHLIGFVSPRHYAEMMYRLEVREFLLSRVFPALLVLGAVAVYAVSLRLRVQNLTAALPMPERFRANCGGQLELPAPRGPLLIGIG